MTDLPEHVASIVDLLAGMPGDVAVVLGGSRAAGTHGEQSDWDLGVYYRGAVDTRAIEALGTVYPPGSWGRVMNGGAGLTRAGTKIDVLLRDLDVSSTGRPAPRPASTRSTGSSGTSRGYQRTVCWRSGPSPC